MRAHVVSKRPLLSSLIALCCVALLGCTTGATTSSSTDPTAGGSAGQSDGDDDETRKAPAEPMPAPTIDRGDDVGEALGPNLSERDLGEPVEDDLDPTSRQMLTSVWTEPGRIPVLQIEDEEGVAHDLPLKHTGVDATIEGPVARVEVRQTYHNPFKYPIEAVYVFPLPENSAVDAMRIVIGERVIEAEIQKRAEARATYEKAKKEGHTAALLEQERPNIFTQSVANIAPGESIDVAIEYVQDLSYDAGTYEMVFPMVVGPRFFPGEASGSKSGTGWAEDTSEVGDASRISPPVVGGGMRTGHDIDVRVNVEAGLGISNVTVPTHDVAIDRNDDARGRFSVVLDEDDRIPNRDFVLRYAIDTGEMPEVTVLPEPDPERGGGHVTLIVQPPEIDIEKEVGKRELVFVVDVSGSMSGKPLAMVKDAMRTSLSRLRPTDTFNVITFAGASKLLFPSAVPANQTNLREALGFVDAMRAGGGTQLANAVSAALSPQVGERHRYVVFMTDGMVGNDKQILAQTELYVDAIARQGKVGRVFAFGTGSSVNRFLLDGMGKQGRGLTFYATNREDPAVAVDRMMRIVDEPVLTEVAVDWGSLDVKEVFPGRVPDVFATRPLVLHARYGSGGSDTVRVRGRAGDEVLELPIEVSLPDADAKPDDDENLQATLWARAKVAELERMVWHGDTDVVSGIENVGLEYGLVTAYTSLVAVDRSRTVGDGDPTTVVQPVEAPEDVDMDKAAPQQAVVTAQPAPVADPEPRPKPRPRKRKRKRRRVKKKRVSKGASSQPIVTGTRAEEADKRRPRPPAIQIIAIGGLSTREVRSPLRSQAKALRSCVADLRTAGDVEIRVSVAVDGSITRIEIIGESDESAATNCARKALADIAFDTRQTTSIIQIKLAQEP